MASDSDPPPAAHARLWRQAPYKQALVIAAIVAVFGALFVSSYGLALGRPQPHHIPTDLVGSPSSARPLVARLEALTGAGLRLHRMPDLAAARHAMAEQHAYATLIIARRPRLLVASAAGASVARVLEQASEQIGGGRQLRVTDVRPLPSSDPSGLVVFYATLAATIMGFVAMFQLRAHASGLTLRAWRGSIALIACLNGIMIAIASGPVIGSLGGSLAEKMGILALESAVSASVCSLLLIVLGRWAIAANWMLFVVLGNASSGGAVAPPLLPPFYAAISRWLPPGACVEALRNAVYFSSAQHAEPFVVLGVWLVLALAGAAICSRRLGRLPTGKPRSPAGAIPG